MFGNFKKSTVLLLAAAFISFLLSVALWFNGFKDEGLYVGLWVPSILAFGSFLKTNYKIKRMREKEIKIIQINAIKTINENFSDKEIYSKILK